MHGKMVRVQSFLSMLSISRGNTHLKENFIEFIADKVMTKNPITLDGGSNIYDAILLMNKNKITALFITKKLTKIPVGILHIHD